MRHESTLRLLILIVNSFLCFGNYFIYNTTVSLQPFLIGTPCAFLNSSLLRPENCCESCLGFNPLEYNIVVGLPLAIATVAGLFTGYIVDRYGYGLFTFSSTLFMVVGILVRALGTHPHLSHSTSYALMLTGSMMVDTVYTILYLVQLYVCARYFRGKYLSFVIGVVTAVSMTGNVFAYYLCPVMVENIGLENTFWCLIPVGAISVVTAALLWFLERLTSGEDFGKVKQTRSLPLSLAMLKEFSCHFWFVSCIIAISWLVFNTFLSNSTSYQIDIYKLQYEEASYSSGVIFITKILFAPIAGVIASRFGIHGPTAVIGCICNLCGLTMLTMAAGPPIIIIILVGLGFAFVYAVMAAVLLELVPFDKLASANGAMNCLLGIAIGVGDIAIGGIAESYADRAQGWLRSGIFLVAAAMVETAIIFILLVLDARSAQRVMCRGLHNYEGIDGEKQPLRPHSRRTSFGGRDTDSFGHCRYTST